MKTERFEMRVGEDFLAAIDRWRREQEDLPPRAEAVRRLVEQALAPTPAADSRPLSELLLKFYEANPENIEAAGYDPGTTPAEALKIDYKKPNDAWALQEAARRMLAGFSDDASPVGREITAILSRIAE